MTKLFRKPRGSRGLVVLNWHHGSLEEFPHFAGAFHDVARQVVAALRRKKGFGEIPHEDFTAYPVVFLYRHALELAMKAVILGGAPLLELKGEPPVNLDDVLREHGLEALRHNVERVFKACGWHGGFRVPHFETIADFRRVIQEFQEIDPHPAVAFRYPVSSKQEPLLRSSFAFDLFGFCEILDELLPVMINAALGAREAVEAANEHG